MLFLGFVKPLKKLFFTKALNINSVVTRQINHHHNSPVLVPPQRNLPPATQAKDL